MLEEGLKKVKKKVGKSDRLLSESFGSKLLQKLASEHGGIEGI